MPSSSREEDRAIAKTVRAALARSALDITQLDISCSNGNIEMAGRVRPPRGSVGAVNTRKEFEMMKTIARQVRGVRDVNAARVQVFD